MGPIFRRTIESRLPRNDVGCWFANSIEPENPNLAADTARPTSAFGVSRQQAPGEFQEFTAGHDCNRAVTRTGEFLFLLIDGSCGDFRGSLGPILLGAG